MADVYKNKSIAEQNSLDIAWDLLMQDNFKDLRRTIYATEEDFKQSGEVLWTRSWGGSGKVPCKVKFDTFAAVTSKAATRSPGFTAPTGSPPGGPP